STEEASLEEICVRVRGGATVSGPPTPPALPVEALAVTATSNTAGEALREFLIECQENLDSIDRDLLSLERDPRAADTLNRLFRSLHTIKGSSGFLGFRKLENVTHAGESLLGEMRDGAALNGTQVADAMLALVDAVRQILQRVETDGCEGEAEYQA